MPIGKRKIQSKIIVPGGELGARCFLAIIAKGQCNAVITLYARNAEPKIIFRSYYHTHSSKPKKPTDANFDFDMAYTNKS